MSPQRTHLSKRRLIQALGGAAWYAMVAAASGVFAYSYLDSRRADDDPKPRHELRKNAVPSPGTGRPDVRHT